MGEMLMVSCGNVASVDADVDAFERFYAQRFRDEALASMTARARRQSLALGLPLVVGAGALVVPVLVNAASVFAWLLLAMGALLLALGAFFLARAGRAAAYCRRRFDQLLAADFEASRSTTKRVFDLVLDDEGIEVRFGTTSGVSQRRRRRWDEVRAVYVTDELVFVPGLTWVCRASTPPEGYAALIAQLAVRCAPGFRDERTTAPRSLLAPAPGAYEFSSASALRLK